MEVVGGSGSEWRWQFTDILFSFDASCKSTFKAPPPSTTSSRPRLVIVDSQEHYHNSAIWMWWQLRNSTHIARNVAAWHPIQLTTGRPPPSAKRLFCLDMTKQSTTNVNYNWIPGKKREKKWVVSNLPNIRLLDGRRAFALITFRHSSGGGKIKSPDCIQISIRVIGEERTPILFIYEEKVLLRTKAKLEDGYVLLLISN